MSGYLEEVPFTDGAEIKKGDLLFKIEASIFKATLDRDEANVKQAKPNGFVIRFHDSAGGAEMVGARAPAKNKLLLTGTRARMSYFRGAENREMIDSSCFRLVAASS